MSPCNSTLLTFYLTPFESQQIKISSLTSLLNKVEELQRKFRTVEKAKLEANVSDLTHSLVKTKASLREVDQARKNADFQCDRFKSKLELVQENEGLTEKHNALKGEVQRTRSDLNVARQELQMLKSNKDCLHEEIESRSKDQIRHWQELFIKAEEERRMLVTKIEELRERELQMIRILDHSIANFTDAQEVVSQATSSAPSSVIGDPNQGHNRADIVDLPNPPTQFLPGRQSMIPDNLAAPLPTIVKNSEPAMPNKGRWKQKQNYNAFEMLALPSTTLNPVLDPCHCDNQSIIKQAEDGNAKNSPDKNENCSTHGDDECAFSPSLAEKSRKRGRELLPMSDQPFVRYDFRLVIAKFTSQDVLEAMKKFKSTSHAKRVWTCPLCSKQPRTKDYGNLMKHLKCHMDPNDRA
ncbi:hypothetical protein D9757_009613 [Collybiopsis confluens]|uniref:Uncharacterized protein n=1 Tax=Collybiopsis confluens TaxID=2823264 RepID=A0A8H5LWM9_9AGAR|nr:hypothetical protein D9757_009613 [Collybiopsis confluens]